MMSHLITQTWRRLVVIGVAAGLTMVATASPARAQDMVSKDTAAAVKATFMADLDGLHKKFVQLAEAFPQDKYTWRPMEGVRSVSEVLVLAASEGYAFVPNSFGGKPGATREEMTAMRSLTDKAKIIDSLNKGFAHAKMELESIDPATLTGKRAVMGQQMNVVQTASAIAGDLHEHLGQMIAYARTNHIVPPWSK
jgi:hypothetical protein